MYGGALFTMCHAPDFLYIGKIVSDIFVSILIKLKNNLCFVWQVVDSYNKEKLTDVNILIFFNMYVEKICQFLEFFEI